MDETYAAAHVIRLWSWALDNAPDGDLSALSDRAIAFGAGWRHEVSLFVAALVSAGWLDDGRTIHDWDEYAGRLIERRKLDAERKKTARMSSGRAPDVRGMSNGAAAGVRRTGPDPTGPDLNRTGPDRNLHPNPPPQAEEGTAPEVGVSVDVVDVLAELPADLTAAAFHDAAEAALAGLGFACSREATVADRGDGHGGRLDLVAVRGDEHIALELDDRTPRQKSVAKLRGCVGMHRVIVLRCPAEAPVGHAPPPPPGIDAVIGAGRLPPQVLTTLTAADRKRWKRSRERLRSALSAANWDQLVEPLEPLGRAPGGGLFLRAPPDQGIADRIRTATAKALVDEGEPVEQAKALTIVEG